MADGTGSEDGQGNAMGAIGQKFATSGTSFIVVPEQFQDGVGAVKLLSR